MAERIHEDTRALDRRDLLRAGLAVALAGPSAACTHSNRTTPVTTTVQKEMKPPQKERMPVLFVGHGSPMNAIEDNVWGNAFERLADELPRPRAILAVSAHWYVDGVMLTGDTAPKTIHDFGGFPQALFEVQYPAPGQRDVARVVQKLLEERGAELTGTWGLDHGTWSVLRRMLPAADIPVVQLSIDKRLTAREHFELARSLHQLRGDGVLVFGSGNVTHNLSDAFQRMQSGETEATPPWASEFDEMVRTALVERDTKRLVSAWPDGPHGQLAHPYPDHWWPLLYAYGATDDQDAVRFPIEGFALGSLSMRAAIFG